MLLVTRPEYELLSGAFMKLAIVARDGRDMVGVSTLGARIEMSATLVNQIVDSLGTLGEDYDKKGLTKIPASRKYLRAYEQYLKHALFFLTTSILPEYDKRVVNAPSLAAKDRLKIYITKVKSKVEAITGLLKKVEKELNK